MWQESFPKAKISIENQEWAVYLKTMLPESPDEEKPNIYRLGWCADYPDSNNWLNEVFNSKSGQNYAMFENAEFDDLVAQAAASFRVLQAPRPWIECASFAPISCCSIS